MIINKQDLKEYLEADRKALGMVENIRLFLEEKYGSFKLYLENMSIILIVGIIF